MKTLAALAITVATLAGSASCARTVQAETVEILDAVSITAPAGDVEIGEAIAQEAGGPVVVLD